MSTSTRAPDPPGPTTAAILRGLPAEPPARAALSSTAHAAPGPPPSIPSSSFTSRRVLPSSLQRSRRTHNNSSAPPSLFPPCLSPTMPRKRRRGRGHHEAACQSGPRSPQRCLRPLHGAKARGVRRGPGAVRDLEGDPPAHLLMGRCPHPPATAGIRAWRGVRPIPPELREGPRVRGPDQLSGRPATTGCPTAPVTAGGACTRWRAHEGRSES
jgi:hypothetical protein